MWILRVKYEIRCRHWFNIFADKLKVDKLVNVYYLYLKAKAWLYSNQNVVRMAIKLTEKFFFQRLTIKQIIEDCKIVNYFTNALDVSFINIWWLEEIMI